MLSIFRIADAPQMLKASRIVGELPHELDERKLRVRGLGSDWTMSVCRGHSVNLLDRSAVVKYLYTMTQKEAVKGIRNAARRRDRADKSRKEARADLKRYCEAALAAKVPISQIAREAKLSRQSVYALLGQSPFQ